MIQSQEEMNVFKLKMNQGLLDCSYCHGLLAPHSIASGAFTCLAFHFYCSSCVDVHQKTCYDSTGQDASHAYCGSLDDIVLELQVKCDCDRYIPYRKFFDHQWRKFLDHQRETSCFRSAKPSAPPATRELKCMLKISHLVCSQCEAPLRPPIFKHCSRKLLVCSSCYPKGDIATYRHCNGVEYLVQGITVKCVACKKYLPFSKLALHQVDDCPFKHKFAPGSSARKKFCDEEETLRSTARDNSIHGKNKRKATFEVGKMDRHIVHSDEVGNDDDSSDDNNDICEDDSIDEMNEEEEDETPKKPETGKRLAANAFKTPACDKKAKIATPSGQKTAPTAAKAGVLPSGHLSVTVYQKPPPPHFVPRRPGTRLFLAAHNKGDKMGTLVATTHPAKKASNRPNCDAASRRTPTRKRPKM